jgi:hypothetical protein
MPRQLPSPCMPFEEQPAARNVSESLADTLRTARYNIQKFYMVLTLRLCAVYGSQNKQRLLPYKG